MKVIKGIVTQLLFLTIAALTLASCGGGGGGGGDDDDDGGNPPPPTANQFNISGKISIPSNLQSDGDVNDPNSPVRSNNSFSEAQLLLNPVTVDGYVNIPTYGEPGASTENGDISDIYKVNLLEGQTISLIIPHHEKGDLDLYTYPETCTDSSCTSNNCAQDGATEGTNGGSFQESGANEKITVASDGEYFIEVCAWKEGSGNYTLVIGNEVAQAAFSAEDNFVPNEMITRFNDTHEAKQQRTLAVSGLKMAAGDPKRAVLLKMDQKENQRTGRLEPFGLAEGSNPKRAAAAAEGEAYLARWDTLNAIAKLNQQPDIAYAEPNFIMHTMQAPNDSFYSFQWHYPLINLPEAWDITTGSSDVVVAVIDTGVKLSHPDLQGQLTTSGYDFVSDADRSGDGDGIDNNANDPGDGTPGKQSSYHGTHVAGTIAAKSNDGEGVAGVSWNTKIMPIRVLASGSGTTYDILQGISYAAGLSNDSGTTPAKKADIINLSLGGGSPSQAAQDVYTQAYNNGVIIVASAGNSNTDTHSYPASYDNVISVSAIDINKERAPYSNFGTTVDVAAPGGDTSVDINGDGYSDGVLSAGYDDVNNSHIFLFYQGTSMSAPHIAGVFALMKAVNPSMTPAQLDSLLASGELTDDLGGSGRDDVYGHGLINALKAVHAAGNPGTPPQDNLSVTPKSLNFGLTETSLALTVSGTGDNVTVSSVTSDLGSISIANTDVDSNGLGTYTLTLDRAALSVNVFSGNITVASNLGDITVPYTFQTADQDSDLKPEIGFLYALLFDADTLQGKHQDTMNIDNNSEYHFSFSDVEPGKYLLIAGSDFDNNGDICDFSESCGVYPSFNAESIVITIDSNRTDLDFNAGYQIGLRSSASTSGASSQAPGLLPFTPRRILP